MKKLFKAAAAFIVSAALFIPQVSMMSYAAGEGQQNPSDSSSEQLSGNPVISGYRLVDNNNQTTLTSLRSGEIFDLELTIKDISLKTSDIGGLYDIDFIKSVDDFTAAGSSITVTSSGDAPLTYVINVYSCTWSGGSTDFTFMIGYSGLSAYSNMSFAVRECSGAEIGSGVSEPIFKITASNVPAIKAGDSGSFNIYMKNLGSVTANRVLVEISCSGDIILINDSASQDLYAIYSGSTSSVTVNYKALDKITSSKQTFNISLRYYYDSNGSELSGSASASLDIMSEISAEAKDAPVVLSSFDLSEKVLEPNTEYSGTVTLNNIGTADMKGVNVSFESGSDFILTGGTSSVYIAELPRGGSRQVPVKIKTLSGFTNLKQELTINVKYSYMLGSDETETSVNNVFTMFGNLQSVHAPIPVVSFAGASNIVSAGQRYNYTLNVENKGEIDMDSVSVKIRSGDEITILSSSDSAFIQKIAAGKKEALKITFETATEISSAKQTFDVELSYYYTENGRNEQVTQNTSVSVDAVVSGAPIIRMKGQSLGGAIIANTSYDYTLTLTNYGKISVKDVYIGFEASESIYFLDGTENAQIASIPAGGSSTVKVRFKTTESILSAKQGITAHMSYSYGTDNAKKTADTDATVTIVAAGSSESGGGTVATPNIIIGSYDIGAEQIAAGETFDLNLELFNTSAATSVENLIMTVNAGGQINIYGGGNTFFYPTMGASGTIPETIPLKALATAETGTSSVEISLKYDYMNNGSLTTATSTQTIFIPVYQPDKMTFEVNVPTYSVYAGNDVYITTTYLNKGRSDISNVKAEIVGDISALSTSKVIGTVVPGGNGSFDFIVTPYMGGECEFTIKVTYEDATLTEVTQEFPVSFYVEEMIWDDPGMYDPGWDDPGFEEPGEEGGFPWLILWIGVGVLVVGGIITIIVVKKRKKKKKSRLSAEEIDWEDEFEDIAEESRKTKV